jgi:hypothetical protein
MLSNDSGEATLQANVGSIVEDHADSLLVAPDDATRNVRTIRFKDKIEMIGDVEGVSNFERCPRNGNVAD